MLAENLVHQGPDSAYTDFAPGERDFVCALPNHSVHRERVKLAVGNTAAGGCVDLEVEEELVLHSEAPRSDWYFRKALLSAGDSFAIG